MTVTPTMLAAAASNTARQPDFIDNIMHSEEIHVLDETNAMSVEMSLFFATLWVLVMGAIPLILRAVSGRKMSNIQVTVATIMWLAVFGGIYLFCNVILFQSAHFSKHRPLYLVECIYLMSQVITTVGYGDITPAYPRGQLFVSFYVLAAIFVIANIVSELVDYVAQRAEKYRAEMRAIAQREQFQEEQTDPKIFGQQRESAALMVLKHQEAPSVKPFIFSVLIFFAFAGVWIVFFHYYPGEEKTWMQSTYFSIITLSTVGFGAFLPRTHGGMVFAAFWMIFGSAALVAVVTRFTELVIKFSEYETFNPTETTNALNEWTQQHGTEMMSEADFLQFALQQGGLVPDAEISLARRAFEELKGADGTVSCSDLRRQC